MGEPGKNNTYPVNVSIQPGVAYANNLAQNAYHTVLFVSNGKEVDRRIVADEAELVLPTATLKGYTFVGWKSSADGKVYDAGDTVKIEKDTTFTALWLNNLGIIGDIIGGAVEEKEFFTDASKVASWAKEAMSWAVGSYVINGKGEGRLDPTGTATRAQVAQILMNFCNNVL